MMVRCSFRSCFSDIAQSARILYEHGLDCGVTLLFTVTEIFVDTQYRVGIPRKCLK